MTADKGTSVLANLTAAVMSEKKTEARKLTPVAGEVAPAKPVMPNDVGVFMSNETLAQHRDALRKFAADAVAIAEGIDVMLGEPEAVARKTKADEELEQKLAEKEADRKAADAKRDFNAEFAAQQKAAQAAVFKPTVVPDVTEDVTPAEPDLGWLCPEHGKAIIKTSAKTQRQFVGCPDCNQFKR